MKLYLFSCLLFLTPFFGLAQLVTVGHESVSVEYYRIPDDPLDPSFTTYSAEVEMRSGELLRTGLTEATLENEYLSLAGYDKLFDRGDVHIEATIGDFNVYGERRGTQQTKSKDKDGKEVVKTQHYIELRYSQPMAIRVSDKKGKTLIDEYIYHLTDDQTWRSTNYSSFSDVDRYWRSSRTFKLAELQKNRIQQGMKVIKDLINNRLGYPLINENERIEKIGRKKHPLYAGYASAAETVKKAFKLMDADKSLDEVKSSVEPAIIFYKKEDAGCKAVDKDGIKLKHIGLYNLALIYFYLEDFEKAKFYAQSIYKFEDKDKDAKRLLEQIDYVATSLERANRTTRHQVVIGGKT